MEIFRLSKAVYANKLVASGHFSRWNKDGQFVIYAASSRALATLESIVRRSAIQPDVPYKVMIISVADNGNLIRQINTKDLPKNWRTKEAYPPLQTIGSAWYTKQESLLLKVPSAIIPYEYNYVINTQHPDFVANVQLGRPEDYFWDERLFIQ